MYVYICSGGVSALPIWLTDVSCSSNYSCLSSCASCPRVEATTCQHSEDVYLFCRESPIHRLWKTASLRSNVFHFLQSTAQTCLISKPQFTVTASTQWMVCQCVWCDDLYMLSYTLTIMVLMSVFRSHSNKSVHILPWDVLKEHVDSMYYLKWFIVSLWTHQAVCCITEFCIVSHSNFVNNIERLISRIWYGTWIKQFMEALVGVCLEAREYWW